MLLSYIELKEMFEFFKNIIDFDYILIKKMILISLFVN
jgi:hypothetical protein